MLAFIQARHAQGASQKVSANRCLEALALSFVAAGVIVVGAFMLLFLCYCLLKKPESVNPGKEAGGLRGADR